MATIKNQFNPLKPDDKEKVASQPVSSVGASPVDQTAPVVNKPVSSGRFVNLNKYLAAANPNAAQTMVGRIQGKVEKETGAVGKIAQDAGTIGNQLQAERDRLAKVGEFANQVNTDPNAIVADENKFKEFSRLSGGQTDLKNWQQQAQDKYMAAQSQLANAKALAEQTGSETGRFDLLRQTMARPTYNRGQQKLDQLLLQTAGGQLKNLQNQAKSTVAQGEQALTTGKEALMSQFDPLQKQVLEAQTSIKNAIGGLGQVDNPATPDVDESKGSGALGGLQDALRKKRNDFIAQQEALKAKWGSTADLSNMDPEILKQLGLTEGQRLYGLNLNDIQTNWAPDTVTEQSIAEDADRARYEALAKLAGTDATYLNKGNIGGAQGFNLDPNSIKDFQERLANTDKQFKALIPGIKGYGGEKGLSWIQDKANAADVIGTPGGPFATPEQQQAAQDSFRQTLENEAKRYGFSDLLTYKPKGATDEERAIDFANKISSMKGGIEKALKSDRWENPFFVGRTGAYGENLQAMLDYANRLSAFNPNVVVKSGGTK